MQQFGFRVFIHILAFGADDDGQWWCCVGQNLIRAQTIQSLCAVDPVPGWRAFSPSV